MKKIIRLSALSLIMFAVLAGPTAFAVSAYTRPEAPAAAASAEAEAGAAQGSMIMARRTARRATRPWCTCAYRRDEGGKGT